MEMRKAYCNSSLVNMNTKGWFVGKCIVHILEGWMFIICFTLFLLLLPLHNCVAQSLTGSTGLVTIPTADMSKDGEMSFGVSFVNKKYNVRLPDQYHQYAYFVTMGYLPFLEVSLRITQHFNYPGKEALGDRMPSVRLRCIQEKENIPSVVLGAHDFLGVLSGTDAIHFNALYLVCSKHFQLNRFPNMSAHIGYGTDWIKAKHREFVGLFGGLSISVHESIACMLEYDDKKMNGGLQVILFNHVQMTCAFLNFDSLSGNLCYRFIL
jgi:hypothetical protein